MINPDIHMEITKAARDLADGMDEHLLAFFGSEEQAKAYGYLFVVEQRPISFSTVPAEEGVFVTYHAETEIRIRPKTLKELEEENDE